MKCCDEVLSPNPEDDSFPYSRSGISGEKEKSISGLVLFVCFLKSYQEPNCTTRDTSRKIQPSTKKGMGQFKASDLTLVLRKEDPCSQHWLCTGATRAEPAPPTRMPHAHACCSKPKPPQDYSWLGRSNWYFMLVWKGFHRIILSHTTQARHWH